MNLNLRNLSLKLFTDMHSTIEKIEADEMLNKRSCPKTGLVLVNASKALFSPKQEHQLFSKGLLYRRVDGKPVIAGVPFFKLFNHGENEWVNQHAKEMITLGAKPRFMHKLDGTLISRNVCDGEVILSTRGMLETMEPADDDPESNGRFFHWSRQIMQEKYPCLLDATVYPDETLIFELVGPQNQIVTFYQEWDLILTGVFDLVNFHYLSYDPLVVFGAMKRLSVAKEYEVEGETLADRIAALNEQLRDTDLEGTVIQFEIGEEVVGRIKAKSDTYKTLLRVVNGCNYATIAEMLQAYPELQEWPAMKAHLEGLGACKFPEELFDAYHAFFIEYMEHRARCNAFIAHVIAGCDRIFRDIRVRDYTKGLNREQRKEFATRVVKLQHPTAYFAFIDDKLDLDFVMTKVLKEPQDSKEVQNA